MVAISPKSRESSHMPLPSRSSCTSGGGKVSKIEAYFECRIAYLGGDVLEILLARTVAKMAVAVVSMCFRVTAEASPSVASQYLSRNIIVNTTGRYRLPTKFALIVSAACHLLMLLRWTGNTNKSEDIYLGSFGARMSRSSTFIAVTTEITDEQLVIVGVELYSRVDLGSGASVAIASLVMRAISKRVASGILGNTVVTIKIIEEALHDADYPKRLRGPVKPGELSAYVEAFRVDLASCVDSAP
ncbi:hypothetical protein EDB81DRAFT_764571 [Dactylonectria macrodidyma]|uniref:Uncharacterized protein n=1 Tax=Dactylonectria macrodidyma TaxID=307937 RepID=A0A9P9DW88_9HYPO|nr:hypothetical protein EDB81DRAFT_764571 [Dactylonectria macrodidyma]